VGHVSHTSEFHWQQVLAGALRAFGSDRQLARGIAGGIYGTYGRTDVLDMDVFVKWASSSEEAAPTMVGEVEALIKEYLEKRKAD
jgi:hypothetical protein